MILAQSDELQRQLFIELLQKPNPSSKTALSCSAEAGYKKLEALKLLLGFYKQHIDPNDGTFQHALTEGREDVVEAFLDAVPRIFVNTGNILEAVNALSKMKPDDTNYKSQRSIAISLISCVETAKDIDEDILKLIIQLKLKDILKEKVGECRIQIGSTKSSSSRRRTTES